MLMLRSDWVHDRFEEERPDRRRGGRNDDYGYGEPKPMAVDRRGPEACVMAENSGSTA
jgi:hypothetical protein